MSFLSMDPPVGFFAGCTKCCGFLLLTPDLAGKTAKLGDRPLDGWARPRGGGGAARRRRPHGQTRGRGASLPYPQQPSPRVFTPRHAVRTMATNGDTHRHCAFLLLLPLTLLLPHRCLPPPEHRLRFQWTTSSPPAPPAPPSRAAAR